MPRIASPLSRKATLVSLNASVWTARKLDRKITDEINTKHHAAADAGRYNKLLVQAECLKKINGIVTAARTTHYRFTLPWHDEGPRILPNEKFSDYANEMRDHKRAFERAADEFAENYPGFVEQAKARLNGMFNETDYPHATRIRSKFKLDFDTSMLPEADDFRSDLDKDTEADIRAEIAASTKKAAAGIGQATADRIIEVVEHMATKLKEYHNTKVAEDGRTGRRFFMDSLVENVRDLAKLLPAFNLNNDPKLTAITARIQKELCAEDAKALRANEDACEAVQKSAESILEDVSKFLA